MIQHHCSTPNQRAYWVSELIAHEGSYGVVGQMSRDHGVSRQSLYTWKAKGQDALQAVFAPKEQARAAEPELERAVLTLLVEAHTSYRGIQTCLESLLGLHVSLGTIVSIVQVAGQRAQQWLSQQKSSGECAVALDEQYGSKRGEAYLNVVDVHSSLVWASVPPVAVDGESWQLVLWYLQEQGVVWKTAVSDGGSAIQEALHSLEAVSKHQRDVWHLLYLGSQVQGRLDRYQAQLQEQLPTVQRQAERIAQGKKARGAHPRTDVQAHLEELQRAEYLASGFGYLLGELRRLLEVVVLGEANHQGILDSQRRQSALETVVQLFVHLEQAAPLALAHEIHTLQNQLRLALPCLLLFGRRARSPPAADQCGTRSRCRLPNRLGLATQADPGSKHD
jgi:hypothetical protein